MKFIYIVLGTVGSERNKITYRITTVSQAGLLGVAFLGTLATLLPKSRPIYVSPAIARTTFCHALTPCPEVGGGGAYVDLCLCTTHAIARADILFTPGARDNTPKRKHKKSHVTAMIR